MIYDEPLICKMTVENFVRTVWGVFRKSKNVAKWHFWPFLGWFWLCFSHRSHTNLMKLHMKDHNMVKEVCWKFGSNRLDSFWEYQKNQKLTFWRFWDNFGCFSHTSYTILMPLRTRGPFRCKIWNFHETLGRKKKQKKRHDCVSSWKLFPTPKN